MKVEPSASQRMAATVSYQMFVALVDEGFTEAQALRLLGDLLSAKIRSDDE